MTQHSQLSLESETRLDFNPANAARTQADKTEKPEISNARRIRMQSHGFKGPLNDRRLHFVGIGGCGMSGLAQLASARGAKCSGSDRQESDITEKLSQEGVKINLSQQYEDLPEDSEVLVHSAAIPFDHPELKAARDQRKITMKYAQMLGELMKTSQGIAVAGTHGKSTTTSLLGYILTEIGLDPSVIVGANCPQLGGGFRGKQEAAIDAADDGILVAEACEFDRSFHHLHPKHATILNVEEDHLDIYGSMDAIIESFNYFACKLPAGGKLLVQTEMEHLDQVIKGVKADTETIGFSSKSDWQVEIIRLAEMDAKTGSAHPPITVLKRDGKIATKWRNPMPGKHMAYNASVAAVMAYHMAMDDVNKLDLSAAKLKQQQKKIWQNIAKAIESFEGLDRRMQRLQSAEENPYGVTVIDDYGHHPTEVEVTLKALREHYAPKRLICVFQPHQHSRTRFLLNQFADSFTQADIIIVPQIYFVRDSEAERHAVGAKDLVDRLRDRGDQALHLYPFEGIVEQLHLMTQPGDLLVTMGAGDVWKVSALYLKSVEAEMEALK